MRLHHYLTAGKILDITRMLWRTYGLKTPFVFIARCTMYAWCVMFRSRKTFELDGRKYHYAFNLQNATFRTERAVEIPIAMGMFPLSGDILEVGNVLRQYIHFPHDVIDKYEKAAGVQNIDVVDFHPAKLYELIISISTFEHVGWDERPKEPERLIRAVQNTRSLLKPAGRMVVTMPIGYNHFLDDCLMGDVLGFSRVSYMKRTSRMNDWVQTTREDALCRKYGVVYPCANAIALGIYEKANHCEPSHA